MADTTTPAPGTAEPYVLFQQQGENPGQDDGLPVTRSWIERNSPFGVPEGLLDGEGEFCGGLIRDFRNRLPHLRSDYVDGFSWKTTFASLFMFCAVLTSTVALGDVAARETGGQVGISEYLMLQTVAGSLHALLSACPLVILRPTGPITAFLADLYQMAQTNEMDYYALLAWVGMWVGLYMMGIAAMGYSKYIVLCTRFMHDIYALFVSTIYIAGGITGILKRFEEVRQLHILSNTGTATLHYSTNHNPNDYRCNGRKLFLPTIWHSALWSFHWHSTTLIDLPFSINAGAAPLLAMHFPCQLSSVSLLVIGSSTMSGSSALKCHKTFKQPTSIPTLDGHDLGSKAWPMAMLLLHWWHLSPPFLL